jgi:hypothetical protein
MAVAVLKYKALVRLALQFWSLLGPVSLVAVHLTSEGFAFQKISPNLNLSHECLRTACERVISDYLTSMLLVQCKVQCDLDGVHGRLGFEQVRASTPHDDSTQQCRFERLLHWSWKFGARNVRFTFSANMFGGENTRRAGQREKEEEMEYNIVTA